MAIKKPIVLTNGEFEQLQAGDYLFSTDMQQMLNGNADPITVGMAVYVSANDTVDLAQANAAGTKNVFGLVADANIANGANGAIMRDGIVESANWTAVTGGATLIAGAAYYLDVANAGGLTVTPPTTGYVAKVGQGVSGTELEIEVESTVKL